MASDAANRTRLRHLFDEHYEAISRYCHRRLASEDANDAAAAVFSVAWRRISDVPAGDAALPWLYTVARYQVSEMRRSARRLANLRTKLNGQARHPEPGPEAVIVRNAEQAALLAALSTLRDSDQEVLRLRAYERLSLPEIAAVLECTVEAAKKRSARAAKRLERAARRSLNVPAGAGFAATSEGADS